MRTFLSLFFFLSVHNTIAFLALIVYPDIRTLPGLNGGIIFEIRACRRAVNSRLPPDIRVNYAAFVLSTFDARKHAKRRHYRYSICTSALDSVFISPFAWHLRCVEGLDVHSMNMAAKTLVTNGEAKDFTAFRKTGAKATHTNIVVERASVRESVENVIVIDVVATWFVYGMMRFIAHALVQVGLRKWSVQQFEHVVENGDRSVVVSSAPACGLCLVRVDYTPNDPFQGLALPAHPCFRS